MKYDVVTYSEIVTSVPKIAGGVLELPLGPGWGVDVNEEALLKHPPINDAKSGIWSTAGSTQRD